MLKRKGVDWTGDQSKRNEECYIAQFMAGSQEGSVGILRGMKTDMPMATSPPLGTERTLQNGQNVPSMRMTR